MMAELDEKETPQADPADVDQILRKRLLGRLAVAAVVIVALLGGLKLFDSFNAKLEAPVKQVARVEPPTRPIEKPAVEEQATEPQEEKAAEKAEAAKEEPAAEPERTEAPTTVARAERPLTVPATPQRAMMRPGEPVAAVRKPEAAKEIARALPPVRTKEQPALASRPIARAVEASRQFLLQVGVFNNLANAEELRTRIEGAGIPAHIEARVQVGPFASRQEAEQAREKLKSIGVEPGIIMAGRK
jgi:cell division protein FtsN